MDAVACTYGGRATARVCIMCFNLINYLQYPYFFFLQRYEIPCCITNLLQIDLTLRAIIGY
jgi:hypothetical protein